MDSLTLAYVLIAAGMLMLAAELFIPSGGILFVVSLCGIVGGIIMVFQEDTSMGLATLIAVVILVPVLGGVLFHYWPRTPMGKRLFLSGPDEDATVATMPTVMELEQFRGKVGRALSALRPSGVVEFDGQRIDTITEGMMVDPGQWVRCIDVRSGRVIVRPVARPDLGTLENADFS